MIIITFAEQINRITSIFCSILTIFIRYFRLQPWSFCRAYFGFRRDSDVLSFRDRFNGYVFIDSKGWFVVFCV